MDKLFSVEVLDLSSLRYTDVLAMLCFYIHNLSAEKQESLYNNAVNSYDKHFKCASKQFPFLQGVQLDWKLDSRVSSLFVLTADDSVESLSIILGAISLLDSTLYIGAECVPPIYLMGRNCPTDNKDVCSKNYYKITALNDNTVQYGLLLPKMQCIWEKNSERTKKVLRMTR